MSLILFFCQRVQYWNREYNMTHSVKSVRIRSYSGPYFRAFGLNTERYGVYLRIQSKCGKIRTRIIPKTDTFRAVTNIALHSYVSDRWDKVFKNGPSKICGREPLKNVEGFDLLKQTIYLQSF